MTILLRTLTLAFSISSCVFASSGATDSGFITQLGSSLGDALVAVEAHEYKISNYSRIDLIPEDNMKFAQKIGSELIGISANLTDLKTKLDKLTPLTKAPNANSLNGTVKATTGILNSLMNSYNLVTAMFGPEMTEINKTDLPLISDAMVKVLVELFGRLKLDIRSDIRDGINLSAFEKAQYGFNNISSLFMESALAY